MIKENINGNSLERGNCYLAFVTYLDSLKGCIFTFLSAYFGSFLRFQLVGTFTTANLYHRNGKIMGMCVVLNHFIASDAVLEQIIKREMHGIGFGLEPILIYGRFIFLIHRISFKHLLWAPAACEIWVTFVREKMTPHQL